MSAASGVTELPSFDVRLAVAAALSARSVGEFHASAFYGRCGAELDAWIGSIRAGAPREAPAAPADPERLRIVHWNIEQGKAWTAIEAALRGDPWLRGADLWTLNEVDWGMARAGNRDVVREVARLLGLHWAYVANFLELGKGPGKDREAPGENEVGMHGIALLSRWPLEDCRSAVLPDIFDTFRFAEERRYGVRRVLWARVAHPRVPFLLATTHLEVRNTPGRRRDQMRAALRALPRGEPCWFAGDWNTHTFRRRGFFHSVLEFTRLQRTPAGDLERGLLAPRAREPLLEEVERAGFRLDPWNDGESTARQVLGGVEELRAIPAPLRRRFAERYSLDGRILRMRLDWIAARGPWRPVASMGGGAVRTLMEYGPEGVAASDHAPIGAEAVWEP